VPLIQLDAPPRALRWNDAKGLLIVSGKLVSQKAKAVALQIQGKAVPLDASGAFTVQVQLDPGATRLEFLATDDTGGTRRRIEGLHWAKMWGMGPLPLAAVGVGAQLPPAWNVDKVDAWAGQIHAALLKAGFQVPSAFGGVPASVVWQAEAVPAAMGLKGCAGVVGLHGLPAPDVVAPPLPPPQCRIPARPICARQAPSRTRSSTIRRPCRWC
jgi:hypothetical protein